MVDAKKPIKSYPHGIQPMNFPQKRLEELRVRELEVEQSMRSEQQRKTYLEEEAQQVIEGTGRVWVVESIKECLFAVASLEVYKFVAFVEWRTYIDAYASWIHEPQRKMCIEIHILDLTIALCSKRNHYIKVVTSIACEFAGRDVSCPVVDMFVWCSHGRQPGSLLAKLWTSSCETSRQPNIVPVGTVLLAKKNNFYVHPALLG